MAIRFRFGPPRTGASLLDALLAGVWMVVMTVVVAAVVLVAIPLALITVGIGSLLGWRWKKRIERGGLNEVFRQRPPGRDETDGGARPRKHVDVRVLDGQDETHGDRT